MKKRRVKKKGLGKKLASYSVAAGAALAVGGTGAEAVPVYTPANGGAGIVLSGSSQLEIDFDNNGSSDVILYEEGLESSYRSQFANASYGNGSIAGSNYYIKRLNAGNIINSTLFATAATKIANLSSSSYIGNFLGNRGFVGVEFDIGGSVHFAWIDIESSADVSELTIYGWAYESVSGTAIAAGAGAPAAVPEPGSLSLLALGAAGLYAQRRRQLKRVSKGDKSA